MGSADTHKSQRKRLRRKLVALGLPDDVIDQMVEAKRIEQQLARREAPQRRVNPSQHHNARRKLRRRLEAEGVSPHLIDAAVERLRAQQAAARRAGVPLGDMDAIYEETYRQMRLDDTGFKPNPGDSVLRGVARATGQSAKAVTRGKTVTKYQHDKAST